MANEVRTQQEGTLWWVQASGSGTTWATASAPQSGLVGYVQSFSHTNANGNEYITIRDRGRKTHQKFSQEPDQSVTFDFLWTGTYAYPTATASGASVPMFHLEFRASAVENPGTGYYYQYYGCTMANDDLSENAEGDSISVTYTPLKIVGPTGSGYIK